MGCYLSLKRNLSYPFNVSPFWYGAVPPVVFKSQEQGPFIIKCQEKKRSRFPPAPFMIE